MTFPLGSLRADGASAPGAGRSSASYSRSGLPAPADATRHPASWRTQLRLLVTAVLWLLALLALATHNAADPAFSTSGSSTVALNKAGLVGAWFSDLAYFVFGYSVWWAMAVALRAWLGALARTLRGEPALHEPHRPAWLFWAGTLLLLAASASLEWTRLYQWEARVAGGHAGGVVGVLLGSASMKLLGFAGSGVLWIAALVAGASMAMRFSWLATAERIGAWVESLRERRIERAERAEDLRLGEQALREREQVVEVEHQLHEEHVPIVIEPEVVDVPASARVAKERQKPLFVELADTKLPQVDLLDVAPGRTESVAPETLEMTSRLIEKKLKDFGVEVRVVAASPGPVITRYEIEPATGVKGAQVVNLAKDLSRSLSLVSIRVVETIPGKTTMALELPNAKRQTIKLSEILGSQVYNDAASQLTMGLGKDIVGNPVVADLQKMPHCLVAGTTGSGKSVGINAMILSLLYKAEARDVRLILIDPKMLEMSVYEGIPHLLCPVVTDMKQAANALNWGVGEMERRYKLMSKMGVRGLASYNKKIDDAKERGESIPNPFSLTPEAPGAARAVALRRDRDRRTRRPDDGRRQEDRGADRAPRAEGARLGIHLILATQRPSVDVITGLIKANIPTRLSLPGQQQDRQPHHPRPDGRRSAARHGRHAVHALGHRPADPRARCLRQRRRGAPRRQLPEEPGRAELHRRHPRGRHARRRGRRRPCCRRRPGQRG